MHIYNLTHKHILFLNRQPASNLQIYHALFSGSTSIEYSLSSYSGANFPSFVSIDSVTGILSIIAPSVSSTTTYSFYIISKISGIAETVKKVITLTVHKCTAKNCQTCSVTDSTVCASCSLGYSLDSGSCSLSRSEVAKALSINNQVMIGTIVLISIGSGLTSISTMAGLWSVINQMQILFKIESLKIEND